MDSLYRLPQQRLFCVTVENVTAEFLTEKQEEKSNRIASVTLHDHAYIELFACVSGCVIIKTENGETVLQSGDIAVIPAHLRHIMADSKEPGECCVVGITFTRRGVRNGMDLYSVLNRFSAKRKIEKIRNCPNLCDAVMALVHLSAESNSCLPALRLTLLLAETAEREWQNERKNTAQGMDAEYTGENLDRTSRLDYLLNSCFMCDLTVKNVAERLFIGERQLMRIVQKRYGKPFKTVLCHKRLDVAAKLLTETDKAAADIARTVGFHSASHFYRTFSARFGMTPNEYRKSKGGKRVE